MALVEASIGYELFERRSLIIEAVRTDLVEAARSGGRPEIERLLQAIWPDAYRLAFAVLGDRPSAEDAAQEACVTVYRAIASLRNPAAFRTWFYRLVVREASALKRQGSRTEYCSESAVQDSDHTASIDIWRALSTLPQHLRDVVVLRYFEDLPSREIASILRIHDGAVRFRLMVARRRLRPLLGEIFETAADTSNEARTSAI
jgi:RNA polymerase sigma-70 factor (ECF subfamily)